MNNLKENNINQILENSSDITESTSQDVASTQDLLRKIIQEKYNNSLMYRICDVFPLKSTLGRLYTIKKKFNMSTNPRDFEVIKKDVIPETHHYSTSFTKEVFQDMLKMYGKNSNEVVASILGGISDFYENQHLMEFIDTVSVEKPELVLPDYVRDDVTLISERVGASVIQMNLFRYKTQYSWCILPYEYSSLFFGYWSNFRMQEIKDDDMLYIGTFGTTEYYIDPRPPMTTHAEFTSDEFSNDEYKTGETDVSHYI